MTRARLFLPLVAFVALAVFLYLGFTLRDPRLLPSALLDKPFPAFDLPLLGGDGERATRASLDGEVRLVNVWATWCPTLPGRARRTAAHPAAGPGLSIVGVNYKDDPVAARDWLARHGDPYDFNLVDADGDLGVDLGVYGAPETFLVDAGGTIRYKHVGAVTEAVWRDELAPAVRVAKAQ